MRDFIKFICGDLDIKPPKISHDTSHFASDKMLACVDSDGLNIYIRDGRRSPDSLFAAAHELRHVWQIKNNKFSGEYLTRDELGVDDYNRQPEEVDANAYASLVMQKLFGLTPLFEGLTPGTVQLIRRREKEITADYLR